MMESHKVSRRKGGTYPLLYLYWRFGLRRRQPLGQVPLLVHSFRIGTEREPALPVDLTRSPSRWRMTGICAELTAGELT